MLGYSVFFGYFPFCLFVAKSVADCLTSSLVSREILGWLLSHCSAWQQTSLPWSSRLTLSVATTTTSSSPSDWDSVRLRNLSSEPSISMNYLQPVKRSDQTSILFCWSSINMKPIWGLGWPPSTLQVTRLSWSSTRWSACSTTTSTPPMFSWMTSSARCSYQSESASQVPATSGVMLSSWTVQVLSSVSTGWRRDWRTLSEGRHLLLRSVRASVHGLL